MKTYISILRGINVSGHNMIKMDALRNMYEGLGFKNVKSYIQSGNVVFREERAEARDLEIKIAGKISEVFGCDVPVMVKELDELAVVLKNNPFANERNEDIAKLHVTFLSGEPEQADIDKIKGGDYAPDEYIISGRAVYLFCPAGYGNTKLNNTFFEKKFKLTATTRNWKTVNELARMAGEL